MIMPLTMAQSGVQNIIHEIHGKDETKRFLESLGFVVGGNVTIVSEIGGNMIVNVKNTRIAISKSMANRIMVA
jgi:ferrous iron transport protein A